VLARQEADGAPAVRSVLYGVALQLGEVQIGLHPIVTSQHSSTTPGLYQIPLQVQ
jgi:hypothetical protein